MKISPYPCENAVFVVFAPNPSFCTRNNKGQKRRERAVSFLFATMRINQKHQGQARCIARCLSFHLYHCPLHDVDNNPPQFQDDWCRIHWDTGFDTRTTNGANDYNRENTATKQGVRNSHHHPTTPPTCIVVSWRLRMIKPTWDHICDTMKDCVVQKAWWKWDCVCPNDGYNRAVAAEMGRINADNPRDQQQDDPIWSSIEQDNNQSDQSDTFCCCSSDMCVLVQE